MKDIELITKLEPIMYSHEKEALLTWKKKLSSKITKREALIYYDACQVLLETIRKRIQDNR